MRQQIESIMIFFQSEAHSTSRSRSCWIVSRAPTGMDPRSSLKSVSPLRRVAKVWEWSEVLQQHEKVEKPDWLSPLPLSWLYWGGNSLRKLLVIPVVVFWVFSQRCLASATGPAASGGACSAWGLKAMPFGADSSCSYSGVGEEDVGDVRPLEPASERGEGPAPKRRHHYWCATSARCAWLRDRRQALLAWQEIELDKAACTAPLSQPVIIASG